MYNRLLNQRFHPGLSGDGIALGREGTLAVDHCKLKKLSARPDMELGSSILGSNFIFTHMRAKKERLVEVCEQ